MVKERLDVFQYLDLNRMVSDLVGSGLWCLKCTKNKCQQSYALGRTV